MAGILTSFEPPFREILTGAEGFLSRGWEQFIRDVYDRLSPLGVERTFPIANNQSSAADVTGLRFDKRNVGAAFVDFMVQRVTTGAGATELVETGTLYVAYRPTAVGFTIAKVPALGKSVTFTTSDVNTGTDVITATDHGYLTGVVGQFTTTGSLPGGFSASTDYYIIRISDNTFQVATSLANAYAGTDVNLTSTGSGTHRFTPRNSGVTFSIKADGQVQYKSTNITGTASISRLVYRVRTLGAKSTQFSSLGGR